jgi:tripartite-type tricarboxylate transporter receptor subunit TctC
MLTTRSVVSIVSVVVMALGAGTLWGQDFPNKPIRILATEAGANFDLQARMIAPGISASLGQPVIVENISSAILPDILAKTAPDGYTMATAGSSFWVSPLTQKTSYDMVRDFAAITMMTTYPYLLIVHPSLPVKSTRDLINLAKANPGVLNIGATASPGGASFLAAELFKAMAGVNMVRVPYKGNASALVAVIAGEVHLMINDVPTATPSVKSGKVRAVAVTSLEPSPLAPGIPPLAATGLPGYELISIVGMMAPAGTPAANINRLYQEIVRFLSRPDVKEKFFNNKIEVVASSPAEFAAKIKSEIAKWGKVLKDAGVKAEL